MEVRHSGAERLCLGCTTAPLFPVPSTSTRDALMHFTYDFYFSPDVKHSITHCATKKEGILLVQAGFSKRKKQNTKNNQHRKHLIAHSCQEQGSELRRGGTARSLR